MQANPQLAEIRKIKAEMATLINRLDLLLGEDNTTVSAYMDKHMVIDATCTKLSVSDVYVHYVLFCNREDLKPETIQKFSTIVSARFPRKKTKTSSVFERCRLIPLVEKLDAPEEAK